MNLLHSSGRRRQKGQIAVEYVLLLMVGVFIWMLLVKGLVSHNPSKPGIVVEKWRQVIEVIGKDKIDSYDKGEIQQ